MKFGITFFAVILSYTACFAQDLSYPVPPLEPAHLFYLQHSRNKNTVVYGLNFKGSSLDDKEPVKGYWIRYSEKGQRQELNYVQKTFAYGIKCSSVQGNSYELSFVSNKKYKMYLQQSENGTYHVYTTINQRRAILTHFFVSIIGGSALSPTIDYVEIFGIDSISKKAISERVKI